MDNNYKYYLFKLKLYVNKIKYYRNKSPYKYKKYYYKYIKYYVIYCQIKAEHIYKTIYSIVNITDKIAAQDKINILYKKARTKYLDYFIS